MDKDDYVNDSQDTEYESIFAFSQKVSSSGEVFIGAVFLCHKPRTSMNDKKATSIEFYEFPDCDQLINLESLLVRLSPSFTYYEEPSDSGAKRRLSNVLASVKTTGMPAPRKSFQTTNVDLDLKALSGEDTLPSAILDAQNAKKAAACIIIERDLMDGTIGRGECELVVGRLDKYARLDSAAIEALNLFPTKDGETVITSSIHNTLNHCVTKQLGSRLLSRWIRQPLVNADEIKLRQDVVESLCNDTTRRTGLQDSLKGTPDLDTISRRLESGKAGLKHLYELYLFVKKLPQIVACTRDDERGDSPAVEPLILLSQDCETLLDPECFGKFQGLVEALIDFNLAPREFRVQIQHDKSGEMATISEELNEIEQERDEERDRLLENELDGMGAKFETDPSSIKTYGFHFRIKKSFDNQLKKMKGSNYNYLGVVNAGIRWGTGTLKSLHERYSFLRSKLDKAQQHLIKEAVTVAATFVPLFERASTLISQLDVLASLAHVAAYAPSTYCRPKMIAMGNTEKRVLRLIQARHPCLENQDGMEFIANDYELDPDSSKFQIITGPNMGGKSTYIRQLGTIIVMAQIGSFVPCEEAEVPVVDAILARVGASDAQLRGVSTFMAEMVEASAIVKSATENSLVIIDELGRGTSTYDGFGLAWAISEYLACNTKPYCLFATHFHELTALANKLPNVKNKHVTALATNESITMLYAVNDGPCEESFGINIAQMAGFPEDVLASAKRKAAQLETFTIKASSSKQDAKKARVDLAKSIVHKFGELTKEQLTDRAFLRNLIATQ